MTNCRHCKKKFRDLDLILECENSYGSKYYTCLECKRKRTKIYRETKIGRKKTNEAVYRSTKKLAYRQKARAITQYLKKIHKIVKPIKCGKCSKKVKLFAHHKDYYKPLKIAWLCGDCHRLEHRRLKQLL